MKLFHCFLAIGLLTFSFAVAAQDRGIVLEMSSPAYFSGTKGRVITTLKELQVWCENNEPDSVLWAVNYAGGTMANCTEQPRLQVLTRRTGSLLQVCFLKRYNSFLEKEEILNYAYDSLKIWTRKNCPDDAVPRLDFKLPWCVGGAVTYEPMEMYFFPFNIGIGYNNPCLNGMPFAVSLGRSGMAVFGNAVLYFNKTNYMQHDDMLTVKVKENGGLQNDKIIDGLVYKSSYKLTDTLVIGGELFKIDSIGRQWAKAYIRRLAATSLAAKLPEKHMRTLAPYFEKAKEYVLLDFWGTWCAPCIAAMPELRELYDNVKQDVPFVSICFDRPENYTKAKSIFQENRLAWPQIFNDMGERRNTFTSDLAITTFPTYMLIRKNGEIVFSSSADGFGELRRILLAQ